MKRSSSGALVSAILLLASTANAEGGTPAPPSTEVRTIETPDPASRPKPAFGSPGTLVLDDVLGLAAYSSSGALGTASGLRQTGWLRFSDGKLDQPDGTTGRSTSFGFAPSVDVFLAGRLSLGGQLMLSSESVHFGNDLALVTAGLAPRIGMAFPLTEGLALWTRISGSVAVGHAVVGGQELGAGQTSPAVRSTTLAWGLGANAMLVANLGRWVALTFGPTLSYGKTDLVEGGQSVFTQGASRSVAFATSGGIAIIL